ncbi:hypothetical protein [Asticcacaulis sp. 201]|uniref:hypothetical protein n=1 Tax=Asticcacaulis sp. 201 TaxID=3028787 RepID=UPI002916AA18|nr:hypothetical protein [Asticcacaulis sp. 201]MDV6333157.1 hypothetical protein [Asticcacaulis sp. 201]
MRKERTITTQTIDWQGITLSVSYEADYLNISRHSGFATAHLQVQAPVPLPFTETGYRSHFLPAEEVDELGGPVAYVLAWLDEAAQSPAWRKQQEAARQLSLF